MHQVLHEPLQLEETQVYNSSLFVCSFVLVILLACNHPILKISVDTGGSWSSLNAFAFLLILACNGPILRMLMETEVLWSIWNTLSFDQLLFELHLMLYEILQLVLTQVYNGTFVVCCFVLVILACNSPFLKISVGTGGSWNIWNTFAFGQLLF